MVDLFASNRYKFECETPGLHGALIFASGLARPQIERRNFKKYPHAARRLFDPQLYLTGLDVGKAKKACMNLASYGWFGSMPKPYDSKKQRQAQWKKAAIDEVLESWSSELPIDPTEIAHRVRTCIEVQDRLGCEAIILPAPLRTASGDDFSPELAWLDVGLELSTRICGHLPRIVSIAISDVVLRGVDPWSSRELDTLIDQVSARGPDGAYIVIEQTSHEALYEAHPRVIGGLIRLVRDLREAGVPRVMVPMAGVAGLLAVAVGAELWSTGWYRSQRRIRLPDFEETDEVKLAIPTYYSHRLAGDVHLKTDLDAINAGGLLGLVADRTTQSAGLLRALEDGLYVANVPDWEHRKGNTTAARRHYAEALLRETAALVPLKLDQRLEVTRRWLDEAVSTAQRVSSLGEFNARTTLTHQRAWRGVLEAASSR